MKPQAVDDLPPHDDAEIVRLARRFLADLPKGAIEEGRWPVEFRHPLLAATYAVRDGSYLVTGYEWIFTFLGGRLQQVVRADASNDYGGGKYVVISADALGAAA